MVRQGRQAELTIMPHPIDPSRDLLFGLLALQTGLVNQAQLVAAFHAWTQARDRPMAEILAEQGALSAPCVTLVEGLVLEYLRRHGNDPERSLAAIGVGRPTRECLAQIGHPELDASLAHVGSGSTEHDGDPDRTATYSVGTATSDGQRFRVLRPHAQGGLGAVFVALDTELHREVALKQILHDHADDPLSRQRFLLEAEVTGGLEHPGIVPVYGLGTYADGRPYYAMRFIRGDSLKEAIDRFHADGALKQDAGRRSLELRKLLRRFVDVCNAIEYAHSRGILHRDLKPGNIIVGKHGETLVVDWGLAKALGGTGAAESLGERPLVPSSASGSAETLPGSALGTPAYMSPEQAAGRLDLLGPHSDVYSLGATLYCLLTGKSPFHEGEIGTILRGVQKGDFPPPRTLDPAIDRALEAVCLKAMATETMDRYATPRALADDVERWAADEPVSAYPDRVSARLARWGRRNRPLVVGLSVSLVAAVAALSVGNVLVGRQRAEAVRQRDRAQTNFLEAERQRKVAVTTTRALAEKSALLERQLYVNRVNLALREVNANEINSATSLLGACPVALRGWEWDFVRGLCHQESRTLDRGAEPTSPALHKSRLPVVGLSPDGRRLVAAVARDVTIYDTTTGRVSLTLPQAHDGNIFSVVYSPDGLTLATGGSDSAIRLWDARTGESRGTLGSHRSWVYSLAFSPDGSQLLSGSGADPWAKDRTPEMKLWDVAARREIHSFPGHNGAVYGLAFHGDGRRASSACGDGLVRHWDTETGALLRTFRGHTGPVYEVAFHPDGRRLASCGVDTTVRLWDTEADGPPLKTLRGHTGFVRSLAFRPDGAVLATVGLDRSLRLWEVASGDELNLLRGHFDGLARVRFSTDGAVLATIDILGAVKLWKADTPPRILTRTGHEGWAFCATLSRDGRLAASGGWGRILLWDAATGHLLATLVAHGRGVSGVVFDREGRRLVSSGADGLIEVWDLDSCARVRTISGHAGGVAAIALHPDGRQLASVGADQTVRLWDLDSGKEVRAMPWPIKSPSALAFSPNGRLLASAGPGAIRLWDPETGLVASSLEVPTEELEPYGDSIAFSPDSGRLAVAGRDAITHILDVTTGREVLVLRGHSREVNGVCYFPDGRRIATGSHDATVKIWDALTGEEVFTLRGHTAGIATVECGRDGHRLITTSTDRTARIWDGQPSPPE
jgi:WD40 repeat protein/serine/threonine protein kinase